MKKLPKILLLAVSLILSACATRWQTPALVMPEKWEMANHALRESPESWWKTFNDPQLDALVDQALRRNNDLTAAALRSRRAQLQAGLIATNLTPYVSVGANSGATRYFDPTTTLHSSGMNASVSYEADLWGKLASQRDSAVWAAQASRSDCLSVATNLTVTTARLYWQLAYLNQLLTISDADIDYAERTLNVVRAKHEAGAVSALNVSQAELNLSTQQAMRTQLAQQRVEVRHALAILFDQPPQTPIAERSTLPETALPAIAPGLPAEILANRPDLQAAEMRLRESLANVDATRSSFYPTLTLTSSLSTASSTLLDFVRNPVATLGTGLILPFVQWNTRQLSVRTSENQYEEAVVNFRQTLYSALAEVEDRLSARTQYLAEAEKLELALNQARRAESISQTRYLAGATEVQLWLDAQQRLRSAERSVVSNRFNQLNNQANLYRALGLGAGPDRIGCGAPRASGKSG